MTIIFSHRKQAGQLLAKQLKDYANRPDVLVLALPRGGVPVAFEIAVALNLPLDVCLVRKLGVPGQPELAMGAIGMGGVVVLNQGVVQWRHIPNSVIEVVKATENEELERRERTYRGNRPLPDVVNRTVILVDDGVATGSTLRAAIATVGEWGAAKIVVAIPVAPPSTCREIKREVDQLICLETPQLFYSISLWYQDFTQTSDTQVCDLLAQANKEITTTSG